MRIKKHSHSCLVFPLFDIRHFHLCSGDSRSIFPVQPLFGLNMKRSGADPGEATVEILCDSATGAVLPLATSARSRSSLIASIVFCFPLEPLDLSPHFFLPHTPWQNAKG